MLREPNLTLERAVALEQFAEQTKIHAKELKQDAEIYGIKFSKKENRYSQAAKMIQQCKYCGITHIRGACPAFHQTCNKCHKKGHFTKVCMSTNKHLNYLDNQNTPLTTAEETLDEDHFCIGAILDTSNGVINNNQRINTIAEDTNAEWSVTLIPMGPTSATKSTLVLKSTYFQKTRLKPCKENQELQNQRPH